MAEIMKKKNSDENSNIKKKSKGKQPIEIKRIENKNARLVAFSKRRKTIFEKLGELYTKFGAQVASIVFSEAGKLYSCGNPSEDVVIHRYLNENSGEGTSKSTIERRGCENNYNCGGFWWDKPVDNLGLVELEWFKVALEGFRNAVAIRVDEINYCSRSNVFGDIEFGMKMQSNVMPEAYRPELSADAFLSMISSRGFV